MTTQRRPSGVTPVPEPINSTLRERLMKIRTLNGLHRSQVRTLSPSSLANYETKDISSIRLGDLFALAGELGTTPEQLMNYLVAGADMPGLDKDLNGRIQRINVYMRAMTEEDQELALGLAHTVMQHSLDARSAKRAVVRSRPASESSRDLVRQALAEASDNGHH